MATVAISDQVIMKFVLKTFQFLEKDRNDTLLSNRQVNKLAQAQ